ncbi:MAG: hypothetical protein A2904_00230 [Candidatus Staskawiczbacteria bacterium RIFCSPLOWO2_01_FULL_33_9]|uniref:Uncharacterized protein n=1 Tax=Candidatus Staskawiczbacteria bacterium RIFCSPLOWO2_01_FULL_33_9 TaxID=1802211 RepID=A0A1G2I9U4_9BACT|nr:MAG: hypothetical protein A2904_00230 [Candidatus Staskawiczbacteria bacterium RIFCSPLOWO2_01_FULL_33_9]
MAEGNLTGPEGILMLMIAVPLDLAGIILLVLSFFGVGIPFSFLLDVLGMVFIGGWLLIRTGSVKSTKGVQKVAQKTLKRFGFTLLAELVPFLGDVYPGWTILVWKELK